MSRANFVFTETSPSAPGTVASVNAVQNAGSYFPVGVAGPMADYDAVDVIADLKGATNGTLDVYVQISPDDGITWYDIIKFPQMGAGQAASFYQAPISNATTTNLPISVGKNVTPALGAGGGVSAGVVVNGAFSDRMRLMMVAGAGTSLGAAVVVRIAPQRGEATRG